jgi:hypothetical protein
LHHIAASMNKTIQMDALLRQYKSAVWGVMHSSYARQLMTIFILFAWINNK